MNVIADEHDARGQEAGQSEDEQRYRARRVAESEPGRGVAREHARLLLEL